MDHTDKEGKSALFAAASMGHLDIVNILLFWGCYADGIDCEGRTVLSVAAAEGSAGVVQVSSVRGEFRKKNRRFKDIRQIGEGGSSLNQKFKIILISDIF